MTATSENYSMDQVIQSFDIGLAIREVSVGSAITAGFRQSWVDGTTDEGERFDLTVGAGVGSRWGLLKYRGRYLAFDVEDLVRGIVDGVEGEFVPEGLS